MIGHGQKLNRNQEKAIAALLVSPSIPAAAKKVGIGESTLFRWLKIESFQSSYREARREIVLLAVGQVQNAMTSAISTLEEIVADNEAPPSSRVSAARTILDLGVRSVEIEDLERRVAHLEKINGRS